MHRFWESIIEPLLSKAAPNVVVEIGAEIGRNTANLIGFCQSNGAVLHVIDPLPRFDVRGWTREHGNRLVVHKAKSIHALPLIESPDAVLIDGDHNWYTVSNELNLLHESAKRNGHLFPMVLLHDVDWPYGRRDLYYNPDDIPDSARQAFDRAGINPGCGPLQASRGLNPHLHNAVDEGGARNGVATAIDDFLIPRKDKFRYLKIPGFHGLGILISVGQIENNPALGDFLTTITPSAALVSHLEALERNRIHMELRLKERSNGGNSC
jgi:hypothetical protein